MNDKNEVFRHELKYYISYEQKDIQITKLKELMRVDPNAQKEGYLIRSLYFDDYKNSAYEDKLNGLSERKKYRIRIYDGSDKYIKLECKRKKGNYIYKESIPLTRLETEQIVNGEYRFLLQRSESLCHKFYISCNSEILRPKVIVDYQRIPYIYDVGTVRITFDQHIRAGLGSYNIFDNNIPTVDVIDENKLIMEVKYTEYLPQSIKSILIQDSGEYTAASKYCMCFEEIEKLY